MEASGNFLKDRGTDGVGSSYGGAGSEECEIEIVDDPLCRCSLGDWQGVTIGYPSSALSRPMEI